MSVDVLREAAKLMRGRVEVCVEGPWEAFGETEETREWFVKRVGADDDDMGSEVGASMFPEEARHIASWHPAVALAVADLLGAVADLDEIALMARPGSMIGRAFILARAYLGSSALNGEGR